MDTIQCGSRWVKDEKGAGEFITDCLLLGGSWNFEAEALFKDDDFLVKDGYIVKAVPACQNNWVRDDG